MERSVKLKLFHIYNHGVAQSCILYPNLLDATLCTKHMLFFINILIVIQDTNLNSNRKKKKERKGKKKDCVQPNK